MSLADGIYMTAPDHDGEVSLIFARNGQVGCYFNPVTQRLPYPFGAPAAEGTRIADLPAPPRMEEPTALGSVVRADSFRTPCRTPCRTLWVRADESDLPWRALNGEWAEWSELGNPEEAPC